MFKPVKTKKVYEEIVEQIKQLIVSGKLQPGDKLPSERELSETFSVSRASVREAFSALELTGIISIRPGEGSFVRQVSFQGMLEPLGFLLEVEVDDIRHLLEVRKILEVETAGLAAHRASAAEIEEMRRSLISMQAAVHACEQVDLADADFHIAVAKAANNPILNQVMNTVSDVMNNSFHNTRQRLFLMEEVPDMVYRSHNSIFTAIAAKDAAAARRAMREHLDLVEKAMIKLKFGGSAAKKTGSDFPY